MKESNRKTIFAGVRQHTRYYCVGSEMPEALQPFKCATQVGFYQRIW